MRDLSLKGEITKIAKLETGTSKAGKEWKKLGFVITTEGEYPKDVYFTVFGEEKTANFMTYNRVGQVVRYSLISMQENLTTNGTRILVRGK